MTLFAVSLCQMAIAEERFDKLIRLVPAGANAIMCADLEAVKQSSIARKNGWAEKHSAAYNQRPLVVPPETELLLVGSQLNIQDNLNPTWEMALLELKDHLPLSVIAKSEGGRQDAFGDLQAVWSPAGAYFVEIERTFLAITSPDDRQFVSRWSKSVNKTSPESPLTEYLSGAIGRLSVTRPVIMSLDLTDALQAHRIKTALAEMETLRGKPKQAEELLPILVGMKGVTLEVKLGDQAEGEMHFDFEGNVSSLRDIAKPLIIESLNRANAELPGLEKWNVHMEPTQVVYSGPLNENALRRIFSLLEIPGGRFTQGESTTPAEDSQAAAAKSSQAYFKSVTALIDDLQSTLKENRDNHAVWMERYARKIDQLPLLGVDLELLDWGASVAETMRTMALAERSSGIRSGVRKSAVYGNYFSYSDAPNGTYPAGSGTVATYTQQLGQISTEERAQAKAVRYTSWNSMLDDTARVRREMTTKYQVEF